MPKLLITLLVWGLSCLAAIPPRLVSTSPQVTELVFQLGHGKDLVATPLFSDYPQGARSIPRLGPLFLPSLERTLTFRPDWVLLDSSQAISHYDQGTQALGLKTFRFSITDPASLLSESRRFLAEVYGDKDLTTLTRLANCLRNLPERGSVSFLAFVWMSPPMLYGHSTFLSHLIERLGGKNAAPEEWKTPYPSIAEDWLLRRKVDVIYALTHSSEEAVSIRGLAKHWWPSRTPKVITLDRDHFARTSFTPFHFLAEAAPSKLPEACRELSN